MIKLFFIIIFLLESFNVFGEFYELGVGMSQIDLVETHENQASLNVKNSQKVTSIYGKVYFPLLSHYLGAYSEMEYLAPVVSTENDLYATSLMNANTALSLRLNSEPFNLILTGEYFYHKINPKSSDYGYGTMTGMRSAAILDLMDRTGSFNLKFKYTYFSQIAGRNEYAAIFQYKMDASGGTGVFETVRGSILKIKYEVVNNLFEGVRDININYKVITIGLLGGW